MLAVLEAVRVMAVPISEAEEAEEALALQVVVVVVVPPTIIRVVVGAELDQAGPTGAHREVAMCCSALSRATCKTVARRPPCARSTSPSRVTTMVPAVEGRVVTMLQEVPAALLTT